LLCDQGSCLPHPQLWRSPVWQSLFDRDLMRAIFRPTFQCSHHRASRSRKGSAPSQHDLRNIPRSAVYSGQRRDNAGWFGLFQATAPQACEKVCEGWSWPDPTRVAAMPRGSCRLCCYRKSASTSQTGTDCSCACDWIPPSASRILRLPQDSSL